MLDDSSNVFSFALHLPKNRQSPLRAVQRRFHHELGDSSGLENACGWKRPVIRRYLLAGPHTVGVYLWQTDPVADWSGAEVSHREHDVMVVRVVPKANVHLRAFGAAKYEGTQRENAAPKAQNDPPTFHSSA